MTSFAIIELEDGWAVVTVHPGQTPEEAAIEAHGILIDPGPYTTYEDAYDVICEMEDAEEETNVF